MSNELTPLAFNHRWIKFKIEQFILEEVRKVAGDFALGRKALSSWAWGNVEEEKDGETRFYINFLDVTAWIKTKVKANEE